MDLESNLSMLIRVASEGNYEELCEIMGSSHFDKNTIDQALYSAVCKSQSASDHLRCVETLINHTGNPNYKDANGVSLLMIAARLGQIQLAELLINYGSSVEDKDKDNRTPLMYAVESCYGDNVDVVKFLLEKKAKVSCQDANGNSALHRSAERGYVDSMQVLLDFGAFINTENKNKDTPLHLACKSAYDQCVELLINKKANIHLVNLQGEKPLDLCPDSIKHMFEVPQECNSDSSFCSLSSHNEITCKICKKSIAEGICRTCQEVNFQYNIQENHKLIENYVKEITELKNQSLDLTKNLKSKTESCQNYKKLLNEKESEYKKKDQEILAILKTHKELIIKKEQELKEQNAKVKEQEEEIDSLREQVLNLKNEKKFLISELDTLRKRLDENQKESDASNTIKRTGKKIQISYLKPLPVPEKAIGISLKDEAINFMQEIEKWQEEVENIYNDLTNKIRKSINKKFPLSIVEIYGSYANKLHLPSSDIDMVVTNIEGDKREILRSIERVLRNQIYVKSTNFIHQASVPVIKVRTELANRTVQIDITINDTNHTGIKSLEFINRLMTQNSFIKPVFIIIKELLYVCNFKEPYTGGLGSYSLFLMVASFIIKQQDFWDKSKYEYSIADFLQSTLSYYANANVYYSPITLQENQNGVQSPYFTERDSFDNYFSLTVIDPLNSMNNIGFNTHVLRLINIFRTAHSNLKRGSLCDCVLPNSALYRMIYDTKENISSYV
ncbi:hypothetical protein SteCoe_1569 [Stentor coeruleus]|uniref:Poly(A) RNA polymerase mitochondrial-like central palm domain-containing protein n=1 Tax=Stentor coeruleus TaxID=5963 RepID=A0A1R2D1P0_9CILI|nr:hypothetical protein SteCoe_1569 [Stentor coeruleus]